MKRRMLLIASSLFSTIAGCGEATADYMAWETGDTHGYSDYSGWTYDDVDDDGWTDDEDCDDSDPDVNPEADEICDDGIDNDCDGLIDDEDAEDCG